MRFKELLEYKRDITSNNYGEKLLTKLLADNSFIRVLQTEYTTAIDSNYREIEGWFDNWIDEHKDEVIDFALRTIESKDPSANKQYTQWIVMRYIDNSISRFEDILTTIETLLRKYHELKVHRVEIPPQFADIGRIKNKANVTHFFQNITRIYDEYEMKRGIEQKKRTKGQAKEVFNNEEMRVVVPEDQDAACYYGQGTAWCTASTSSTNYFDHYSKDGPLYVIIPKQSNHDGEKYQLHFESGQYMDEGDGSINLQRLFTERFTNPSTFEFFNEKGDLSSMLAFANDQVFEDIVQAIKIQVSDYVREEMIEWEISDDYYHDFLRDEGHWDEEEDAPSDDAPSYMEYNDEAHRTYDDIMSKVDISKDDVTEWDTYWEDDETYTLKELPYVVASILRDSENRGEGFRGQIADQIEKNLSLNFTQGTDPKMPAEWTLHYEYQVMRDGKTQWKKYKVAEKSYV
jgi:hypothetical protein